jgi:predicted ATPase/DNA-binding SARP family transcriptional activator
MGETLTRLFVLGPFDLNRIPGQATAHSGATGELDQQLRRKTRALLAYLAAVHEPVRREALAALFFPDSDDPLGALRWQLSAMRRQIGAALLVAHHDRVQLDHAACWVDAEVFEQTLDYSAALSIEQIVAALDLYRGEYLADISLPDAPEFDMWLLGRRAYYRQRYEHAVGDCVERMIQHEQYAPALAWAQRLVESNVLAEETNLQLIRLYALTGQRDAALAHYERYRRLLYAEIQAEPGLAVSALYAEIMARRVAAKPRPSPTESPAHAPHRHALPASMTPFLGRELELMQLQAMLTDPAYRLVTLHGPGGIGKTRLAIQIAALAQRADNWFPDGTYLVMLAAATSEEALIASVADALGLPLSGANSPRYQLLAFLRDKAMLLVLDNLEHLASEAGLLAEIVQIAPKVTILATSRLRLNLYEEWCFDIQGLQIPQAATLAAIEASSAAQLFIQRARAIQRDFALDAALPGIVEICKLLDGLPLAIELAAGWVRTHTCREIAAEIRHGLDLLATNLRNVPERHRSMRAAIEHSWRLIPDQARTVFSRLSVFHGGFDHDAAAAVAGATRPMLCDLLDAAMLSRGADGRYQIHELLRQYAVEHLDDPVPYQLAHARFFAAWCAEHEAHLVNGEPTAIAAAEQEIGNLRAAWLYATTHVDRTALDGLLVTVASFAELRGAFQEARDDLLRAIQALEAAAPHDPDLLLARLTRQLARCYDHLGQFAGAKACAERSMALFEQLGAPLDAAGARAILGFVLLGLGDNDAVQNCLDQSLAAFRSAGHLRGQADTLYYLSFAATGQGQLLEGQHLAEECLGLYRRLGDHRNLAHCLFLLGNYCIGSGAYTQALDYYSESKTLHRAIGNRVGEADCLRNEGLAALYMGQLDEAERTLRAALQIFSQFGNRLAIAVILLNLGRTLAGRAEYDQARECLEQSLAISCEIGNTPGAALTLAYLGHLRRAQGDLVGACDALRQAVEQATTLHAISHLMVGLLEAARLLLQSGESAPAVRALAHVANSPATEAWECAQAADALRVLAATLPPDRLAALSAQGQTAAPEAIAADILAALG